MELQATRADRRQQCIGRGRQQDQRGGFRRLFEDLEEKIRVWNLRIFGYDLGEFWPSGPDSKDLTLIHIDPLRVELGVQPAMWLGQKPEVWKA